MKTLKNEIKELAQNLRALKLECKESNRATGYAPYGALEYRRNEFRLQYLAYCWLKSNKQLSEEQFFDKYENKSKEKLDIRDIAAIAARFSDEIERRKKNKNFELFQMRNSIKFKKLALKEEHRTNGHANYYLLESMKENYRYKHLAYCLHKKNALNINDLINPETLLKESFLMKSIIEYKLEKPNKDGALKSFNANRLNNEILLLKEAK